MGHTGDGLQDRASKVHVNERKIILIIDNEHILGTSRHGYEI